MRSRRWISAASAGAFGALVAGVTVTASGQDGVPSPGAGEVKYFQGKVSPPPAGLFPGAARPAATPPQTLPSASNIPTFGGQRPGDRGAVKAGSYASQFAPPGGSNPAPVQQAGGVPRLTQPVVAGPGEVRVVGNTEAAGAPPYFNPTPQLPPSVKVEPSLPEPKPLPVSINADSLPAAPIPALKPVPRVTEPTVAPIAVAPVLPVPSAVPPVKNKPVDETPVESPKVVPLSVGQGVAGMTSRQVPNVVVEAVCPETIGVNQSLVYELVVRNVGTAAVANVRVEDELPAKCQFLGSTPPAETAGDRLAWSIGALESGAEKRISVTVKPLEEGEVRSRAVVSFTTAVEARVRVTRPKIAIAMTGPETTRVGEKVPFQIKLTNTGTGTAGKILLQAKFSEGLTHVQGQVIEAELANLPAGQSKTLSLEVVAGKSGPQVCSITAVADGSQTEVAKVGVNLVEPMLLIKQTGPSRYLVRSEPTYTIELSNPGTASTDPVELWAALPAGIDFLTATDGGAFLDANRAVGWRMPGLAAGTTKTVTFKVRAVAPTEGAVRTVAQAVAATGDIATVETRTPAAKGLEARAETLVRAEGVPALRFEVSDLEDPIEVGKEATYEIRVVNQGTGVCTNVQIVAELADSTTVVGAPTGPTVGKVVGQQITFEPIPQLGVKAEAVYRVRVKGSAAGDYRFRVKLVSNETRQATTKEENTRFYKE